MTTPAEELRAAARLLRGTATAVPYGPPWAVSTDGPNMVVSGDMRPWGAPVVADTADEWIAAWIALASPQLAETLAAWLEAVADAAERHAAEGWGNDQTEITDGHPIAVARTILGRQS